MKVAKELIVFFTVSLLLGGVLRGQDAPMMVAGTYTRGSNLTEPRPVKSKFLETIQGGVVIINGKAGFYLIVNTRKPFGRPVYVTTEYENPVDPTKPLVNDMSLPAEGGQLNFSSPDFVRGLKINEEYRVTVKVFESKAASEPMDTLVQKIRSYVDWTGPEVKIYDRLKTKGQTKALPQYWQFTLDGRNWVAANKAGDAKKNIHEYILEGESLTNWSEMVTSHYEARPVAPKALFEQMKKGLSKDCATLQIGIIQESADDLVFEWRHNGCNGYPAQHEIRRIVRTKRGTLMLSYVRKTERLTDEEFSRWLAIIQTAEPRD